MASPTARTLQQLRARGWTADVAERWIPHANIRRDLFGCIDLVAVHPREAGVLGVQATTAGNIAARLHKARCLPALRIWLTSGNHFQVWGWTKRGKRWRVRIVAVRAEDLAAEILEALPRRRRLRKGERQRELFD